MALTLDLSGHVAVVTGSTSGIGLGIATSLAMAGAKVALNSHLDRPEDHEMAADLAEKAGVEVIYVQADMSNGAACASLIEQASAKLGTVDILVNNAGIQYVAPIEEFPVAKWDAIIAINLASAFHTIRAAVPGMKEKKWGRIINIASAHGLTASPYKSAYVSAKHGLVGLSKTIALELAEHGGTCNAICPGYVLTPLVEGQIPDQMKAHNMSREGVIRHVMLERQPTKEFVTVDELGALSVLLASDMGAQITGAALPVDGGWTAM